MNNTAFIPTPEDPLFMVVHQFMPGTDYGIAWIQETVQALGLGSATRKLGVAPAIFTLQWSDEFLKQQLDLFFAAAEQYNVPLLLHLDSEHFYDDRYDLWNWWNASLPGFDPGNIDNVEWSDWGTPTKLGFLNWGSPIQMVPRLCFESIAVRNEISRKDQILVDKILEWQANLSMQNKTDLFLGIDPGWETGIDSYENVDWVPEEYQFHLGYNALAKRGFNATNPPADMETELAKVVKDFAEFEARTLMEKGIPREKLFTHIWGAEESHAGMYHQHAPLETAFNDHSIPGFSLYPGSYDLKRIASIVKNIHWTLMETPPLERYDDILRIGVNKMVVIYNWGGGIKNNQGAITAIKEILEKT